MYHPGSALARAIALAGLCSSFASVPVAGQGAQPMAGKPGMMTTPLGIPMDRMGSGTTWIPDAVPIAALHGRVAGWEVMGHGLVFGQYINQGGPRGDRQFGSLNWGMLMASHPLAGGMLQLRTMLSLEPAGVTARGYPLLLQSGESFEGEPIHDRQHPHDFWMELGVLYLLPISRHLAIQLYAAPSGEPALGPVAFMHRPSAIDDPIAPLGHHWQDATHTSFGVVTAGLFTRNWKLEGSLFNGREPDEHRWDFDLDRLDSYAGRLTWNPGKAWSLTASYGHLKQSDESSERVAASVLHGMPLGDMGQWATTLVYTANVHAGGPWSNSVLLESEAMLDRANTLFGRFEFVQKSAEDLLVTGNGIAADRRFNIAAASLGYIQEVVRAGGITLGVGARGALGFLPAALEPSYGTRTTIGGALFLRLRPERARGMEMPGMPGMRHDSPQQ